MNVNKDIKIQSVSIQSYKGVDNVTIDCNKNESEIYQWTVLLGNNNTGKTRILQAIASLCPITLDGRNPLNHHLIVPYISLREMENWDGNNQFNLGCNLTNYGEWEFDKYVTCISR
ncbi:MAG: AAA family ATPase [Bacteroidales bacterium]|nr:AAA family ATPase [Bacteroidales bacterium]